MNKLELPLIAATSPTLAEAMRSCSLRAVLSRTPGSGKYVLGNPKGWLGSAYHQVLENIADAHPASLTTDAVTETIKAAYVRQLQIYGYLVHATLGRWLQRGVLLPAAGPGVEIQLREQDCEREALEAVELLDTYNRKIAGNVPVTDLAAPSRENCKWCPNKIFCPAFWAAASADWSGSLDGAAVEGVLVQPPRHIHGGAGRALSIEIRGGSEAPREINVAPVNPVLHDVVDTFTTGDAIRVVALRVRSDGVFVPQMRTIVMRVDQLPELNVHTDPRPG
jgi:hypothetical protein